MASTPSIELRPRSVGELLDVTFALYRRHFRALIVVTLVVMGPMLAISLLSSAGSLAQYAAMLNPSAAEDPAQVGGATLLASSVSLCATGLVLLLGIAVPWMDGALTFSVIERVLGRTPSWREVYRATQPRWAALWVATAVRNVVLWLTLIPLAVGLYGALFAGLLGIGSMSSAAASSDGNLLALGLMAICLPIGVGGVALAIFVTVAWSMTTPVIVGEGADGIASLGRSNTLVQGMRWRMAGRLLIFEIMRFLLITIPTGVMQAFIFGGSVAAAAGGDLSVLAIVGFIGSTLFGLVANVLVVPLYAIYITVNYLDLRIRKEQLDLQLQAAQLAPALSEQPAAVSPAAPGASARAPTAGPAELPPVTAASPAALPPAVIGPASSATAQPIVDTSMTPAQRISVLFNQIRTEGENAELLNELGLAYHQIGDLYGALDALTRARARAPNDPAIAYNMAVLQRDRRDMPAARRAMADYLRLETDEAERQRVLANPSLRDLLPQQ
jgi:hypothetical protein